MSSRLSASCLIRLAVAASFPAVSGIALAQIQQLPRTSEGEGQVNQLNSNIGQQQQIRGIQQQNQVENNRTQMQIQTAPQPVPVPAAPIAGVPRR